MKALRSLIGILVFLGIASSAIAAFEMNPNGFQTGTGWALDAIVGSKSNFDAGENLHIGGTLNFIQGQCWVWVEDVKPNGQISEVANQFFDTGGAIWSPLPVHFVLNLTEPGNHRLNVFIDDNGTISLLGSKDVQISSTFVGNNFVTEGLVITDVANDSFINPSVSVFFTKETAFAAFRLNSISGPVQFTITRTDSNVIDFVTFTVDTGGQIINNVILFEPFGPLAAGNHIFELFALEGGSPEIRIGNPILVSVVDSAISPAAVGSSGGGGGGCFINSLF